jgi:AcrR family transcriptional regulator
VVAGQVRWRLSVDADELGGARGRRTGRRTGPTVSNRAIVQFAREQFSRHGYDGTTTRTIAAEAHVDSALIHHFFLTKEGLFEAAVRGAFNPPDLVSAVTTGARGGVGERMVRLFLTFWDEPDNQARLVAVLRSMTSLEGAAAAVRGFLDDEVLHPVTMALGYAKPRLRAALVGSQLVGLATMRYVFGATPIASLPPAKVASVTAGAFQANLVGIL